MNFEGFNLKVIEFKGFNFHFKGFDFEDSKIARFIYNFKGFDFNSNDFDCRFDFKSVQKFQKLLKEVSFLTIINQAYVYFKYYAMQ